VRLIPFMTWRQAAYGCSWSGGIEEMETDMLTHLGRTTNRDPSVSRLTPNDEANEIVLV